MLLCIHDRAVVQQHYAMQHTLIAIVKRHQLHSTGSAESSTVDTVVEHLLGNSKVHVVEVVPCHSPSQLQTHLQAARWS
jgi:hypothetical protein